MAQGGSKISGIAVAAATVGALLIYAALRDVTPVQALKDVLSRKPPGIVSTGSVGLAVGVADAGIGLASGGGTPLGGSSALANAAAAGAGQHGLASAARKYLGIPYKWGGASPSGFDCSGLVTWVLVHDLGHTNLPSSTHTVTTQFLFWRGAQTVSGPPQVDDLICWLGHIAIASGNGMMIEAPHTGANVREVKIRTAGATIRRVL